MIQRHTVTLNAVSTTEDDLGNSTDAITTTAASGILFAPEGLVENPGADSPRVLGDATLYGILPRLDSDDTVTHDSDCCDGADFAHGTWQVEGGSKGWGGGKKVVPIKRPSNV